MPETISPIQRLNQEDLISIIEGDQGIGYLESISYVVQIGRQPSEVMQEMRLKHGILPFPTNNRELNPEVLSTFWKLLERNFVNYRPFSLEDLENTPVNDWPCVPVGQCGPLLMVGHCCPPSRNVWGIDPDSCPQVWLPPAIYFNFIQRTLQFLSEREVRTREEKPPPATIASLRNELEEFDPEDRALPILKWMLDALPMNSEDREFIEESVEEGMLSLPGGYSAAIEFIRDKALVLDIRELDADRTFYERIPRALVDRYKTLCFFETAHELYVCVQKLDDYECEDQIINRLKLEKDLVRVVTRLNEILMHLERFENVGVIETIEDTGAAEAAARKVVGDINLNEDSIRLVNPKSVNTTPEELLHWLIYTAILSKASDIHIEQYKEQARFRTRIDGILTTIYTGPLKLLVPVVSIVKNHCNMTLNTNDAQDGRFSIKFAGRLIDARVSAIPWRRRFQKVTIRLLDKSISVKSLEEMGLPADQLKLMHTAISRPQGMIVVTGPTGSGKSTTLYAALSAINKPSVNIQTIEDPIEYEMEGINQTQVDENQHLTFSNVLRRILRADPDVVLVGEVRDRETAVVASEAALTGHLILTTLHSLDAIRAIGRLLSMGVAPYMLADSLILLHAQRLIRRLCRCRQEEAMDSETEGYFEEEGIIELAKERNFRHWVKRGCAECYNNGYRGRMAVMELCPVNDPFRDLITGNPATENLLRQAEDNGYEPMFRHALRKTLLGATSVEECLRLKRF